MIYDDLPIKNDDFPVRYVKSPKGTSSIHVGSLLWGI